MLRCFEDVPKSTPKTDIKMEQCVLVSKKQIEKKDMMKNAALVKHTWKKVNREQKTWIEEYILRRQRISLVITKESAKRLKTRLGDDDRDEQRRAAQHIDMYFSLSIQRGGIL